MRKGQILLLPSKTQKRISLYAPIYKESTKKKKSPDISMGQGLQILNDR